MARSLFAELPIDQDDPTPTSAHICLKGWVEKLIDDVNEHPVISVRTYMKSPYLIQSAHLDEIQERQTNLHKTHTQSESDLLPREVPSDTEMYYADSYEDLLATAIINKVSTQLDTIAPS